MELWQQARAEFVDVIDWSEDGSDTLVWRFKRREQEAREQQDREQENCAEAEQRQRTELDGGRLDLLNTDLLELLVRLARNLL